MAGRFDGKVALVTGSGQSLGRAIALLLAAEGARVVTNSRRAVNDDDTPTAADTAAEIVASGGEATAVFADLTTMDGCASLVDATVEAFHGLDILINNAGAGAAVKPLAELSDADWTTALETNLHSQFGCSRRALPLMQRAGWGRIVNVGSNVGLYGLAQMAPYSAAKAGVLGLTFAIAHEVAGSGITANCLLPTANSVRNERTRAERHRKSGHAIEPSPLRTPEAVAPLVGYLCGDAAAGINGQVLYCSAGQITVYSWPPAAKTIVRPGQWGLDELDNLFSRWIGSDLPAVKPPLPLS